MTGRAQPTTGELTENLRKRMLLIESVYGTETLAKRYNRVGVPSQPKVNTFGSGARLAAKKHKAKRGKHGRARVVVLGAAAVAGAGAAGNNGNSTLGGNGPVSGNGTVNGNCDNSTVGGNSNSNSNGTVIGNTTVLGPNLVTPANPPTANNSLGLDIEANDVGYLATVQMGTPPQSFLLLMDSGSADTWVGGENCQSQQGGGCGNHTFLGTKSSSTFNDSATPFQVTYGTGNVAGTVVQDNLAIAGLSLNAHTFGVATSESIDFASNSVPFDGLMGLAQSSLSDQKTLTPIESLAQAGLVPAPITSFKLSRLADNKSDGEVTFGGLDSTKFKAQTLVSLPNVNQNGFWEAAVDAVTVGGNNLGLNNRTAILDTGTTLIITPQADADAVHQAIPGAKSDGQGGFTIPCGTTTSLAMTFGGQSFAIDPRDLAVQPVDPNNPTGDCISGIAAGNVGTATEWLMGDVFLKNAYFSTDVAKNTVSLAQLV